MAYGDLEKAEALIRLAVNHYDYPKTAGELDISIPSLRRWNRTVPKKGIGQLLERAIEQLLMRIPEKFNGQEWAVTVGILMDKWLLAQGQATSRTESIERRIGQMTDDEYYNAIDEAERILAEAAGGGA